MPTENVLCVKAEALGLIWPNRYPDSLGIARIGGLSRFIRLVSLPPDAFVRGKRPGCETDESIKQLVTYTVIICDDEVLTYRRSGNGGEGRLHARRSIGIGGHVDDMGLKLKDVGRPFLFEYLREEPLRELMEELCCPSYTVDLFPTGLIYDPSNPVGRVHLGVVFSFYPPFKGGIGANCPSLEDLRWESFRSLRNDVDCTNSLFESWSQLLLSSPLFI